MKSTRFADSGYLQIYPNRWRLLETKLYFVESLKNVHLLIYPSFYNYIKFINNKPTHKNEHFHTSQLHPPSHSVPFSARSLITIRIYAKIYQIPQRVGNLLLPSKSIQITKWSWGRGVQFQLIWYFTLEVCGGRLGVHKIPIWWMLFGWHWLRLFT